MTFSKRVGMEPAGDLKKRIIGLCEEAGFIIASCTTCMHREETLEESVRRILIWTHAPDWEPTLPETLIGTSFDAHKDHQMEVRATIGCDGTYDGTVEVLCMASDQVGDLHAPTLRDCRIPIDDLPERLPEINQQMRFVIAARKLGEKGPWQFGEMQWKNWK